MNRSFNKGNSESCTVLRNRSLRSIQELKSISKELHYKKPQEVSFNKSLLKLDDEDLMIRHRCSFINAKIKADREKSPPLSTEKLKDCNSICYSNELVATLGPEKPEIIFRLTTNFNELKRQVELSKFDILGKLGLPINLKFVSPFRKKTGLRPVNRKDIDMLEEWLDFMLEQISNNSQNLFEDAQVIYSAALQEIINQVKVNCMERGNLLERVWKSYFSLMISAIKQYQTSNLDLKVKTSANLKLIEAKYKETISTLQSEVTESSSQITSLKYSIESLTKMVEKYKFNEKLQQTKFNVVLGKYEKDKVKLLRLEDTNNNLKHLVRTVLDDIDSDMPGMKKMREKNKIRFRNISEILISDPVLASRNEEVDLNMPEQEIEEMVEKQRVELENKIFLQEIKEQMMDTEEEMEDKEVNTTIKDWVEVFTQTEFECFDIEPVQVDKEVGKEKFDQFNGLIAQMLSDDNMPNEERLKTYFNFDDVEQNSEFEGSNNEVEGFNYQILEILSLGDEQMSQVKEVFELLNEENCKVLKEMKRKVNYFKIKKQISVDKMKELRKMLFAVVNENLDLKQKLRSGSGVFGGRKIIKKQGTRKKLTITKEFALGNRKSLPDIQEEKVEPDRATVTFLMNLVMSGKFKEKLSFSKRGLQRIINNFIHDLIALSPENLKAITSPILYFFTFVCSKFPIKAIAKANFAQYLLALKTYKSSSKIFKLFSRLLGLSESLDVDYFYTFVELFKVLFGACQLNHVITDSNEEVFIALQKCEESVETYWKGKILDNELQDLKKTLQKSSITCPKNFNRSGVVHQADFLECNLRTYVYYLEHSKHQVKDLFDSMDLAGDGFLNFEEFKLIFRNLEKKSFTEFYAHMLFMSYTDIVAEFNGNQYPALSYLKFAALSAEKGLFQNESQENLLQVTTEEELTSGLDQLFTNHSKLLKNIEWKLVKLREASGFIREKLDLLQDLILKGRKTRNVLMAFKLLDLDTQERILAGEVSKYLPSIIQFYEKTQGMMSIDRNPPRRELKNLAMADENDEGALF